MFELVLIFYLTTQPPERGQYQDRTVHYETIEQCRAAVRWWMTNTDSELPGMDPAWGLLRISGRACEERPAIG